MAKTSIVTNPLIESRASDARRVTAELDHVTIRYTRNDGKPVVALNDVSLQLYEGEFLVLVGASGSGKTTALNVMAGLADATSGSASVLKLPPAKARDQLGYMFARDALLPWRTALQNIEFGMELRGLMSAERRKQAENLLDVVKLGHLQGNYPTQLSQGQRQRVALARTWALSPKILLMDEPFSALDAQTREDLQSEFLRMWSRDRKSIVFVTHDLIEAVTMADRIVVFSNGSIAQEFVVPLERPRDILAITEHPEAKRIYKTIRELMHH